MFTTLLPHERKREVIVKLISSSLFFFAPSHNPFSENIFNIPNPTQVKGKERVDEVLDMFVRPFM